MKRGAAPTGRAFFFLALAPFLASSCEGPGEAKVPPPVVDATPHDAPTQPAVAAPPNFADVVDDLERSVVAVISTVEARDDDGRNRVKRGIGAGVIVSANGEILTNEHVVASASAVHVELANLDRIPAKVLYRDPRLDLALLRLEKKVEDLEPVRLRERSARRGEWVMAIGQPYGLGHTMTVGIVSGLGRDYGDLGRPQGLRADGIWSFIQTDASVNIGNSGGPLVDVDGAVVGITTAVRVDGQGLAFAIPVELVRLFLSEVRTYGRVRHPRLGIRAKNVGPEVYADRMRSVQVTDVSPDGAGARAGLRAGDIVLEVAGDPVARLSDLTYRVLLHADEGPIPIVVHRDDGAIPLRLEPDMDR